MMNRWKITTAALFGIIVVVGTFYAMNEIQNVSYQQGMNDAVLLINQQVITNLYQNGYITITVPINETAVQNIRLVPQVGIG